MLNTNGGMVPVLIKRNTNNSVQVTVNMGANVSGVNAMVLSGPSLGSTNGFTLGGAGINPDGSWPRIYFLRLT